MAHESESTPFRSRLMDVAHPNLYRINAFRITGLPTDATPRDVVRQAERLKIAARIGNAPATSAAPFPLSPAPEDDDVRGAVDRLRDPERRLVEELFWFWPHDPADPQNDRAR